MHIAHCNTFLLASLNRCVRRHTRWLSVTELFRDCAMCILARTASFCDHNVMPLTTRAATTTRTTQFEPHDDAAPDCTLRSSRHSSGSYQSWSRIVSLFMVTHARAISKRAKSPFGNRSDRWPARFCLYRYVGRGLVYSPDIV